MRKVNNLRFEEFEKQKQIFALKFSNYLDRMSSFKYEPFVAKVLSEKDEEEALQKVESPILRWMDTKFKYIQDQLVSFVVITFLETLCHVCEYEYYLKFNVG